jgi:hypothetical protein
MNATAPRVPAEHRVELVEATSDRAQHGITHLSRYVFRTSKSHYPTRVKVWTNVNRPNPRNGQPVKFGEYGKIDGGDGQFGTPGLGLGVVTYEVGPRIPYQDLPDGRKASAPYRVLGRVA